ncbi:aldolase [Paenibacillus sp. IITD108]|uniref:aldolase n=1 Tax=Paenibacillus sp. IITD108 TaxID=3116649 RepID=UPI002F400EDD
MLISKSVDMMYSVFGLTLQSEIELQELLPTLAQPKTADVTIRQGDLKNAWKQHGDLTGHYGFNDREFYLYVPDAAIFCVREGREIIISPHLGANEKLIRLYLLGTCMGALLMQRRTLPLHGSAIAINGKAYAFVGDSGAGKSTTAAAFLEHGCPLLSDDVVALSASSDYMNIPFIYPAYPQQKLWQASFDILGKDSSCSQILYDQKYAVPVHAQFCSDPMPIGGVFELVKDEQAETIHISANGGLESISILMNNTYRSFLIPYFGLTRWHFAAAVDLAGKTKVYRIIRPAAGCTTKSLKGLIMEAIQEEA